MPGPGEETEITQEEDAPVAKARAEGFVNWEVRNAEGNVVLKSSKGYALFDTEKYPISKADAILLRKAAENGGRCEIPVVLTVVVNGPVESANDFDLDKLDI